MDSASGQLTGQLTAALRHPVPEVRAGAALALGRLGHAGSTEQLIECLADPVRLVHQNAARGLGMLGIAAAGALLALIQDPPFEGADQRAARALAQIRDPAAIDILTAALQYREPLAREGAVEALGGIGDPRAVPALAEIAFDEGLQLGQKVAAALLEIGDPQGLHVPMALLNDGDPRLRQMAVEAIGQIGGEQALLSLLTTLSDPNENVRLGTADALRALEVEGQSETLVTALNTNSPWEQQVLAEALARFPRPDVIETLHRLATQEGDLETRLTAAQSLAVLGDPRGPSMIRRTFNAPNHETRRLAAIALAGTGDPQAVEFLLGSVSNQTLDLSTPRGRLLRRKILQAFETIGRPAVVQLAGMLNDPDAVRRQISYDALVQIGPDAVPELSQVVLAYPGIPVRVQAARLLGQIGDREGQDALITILRTALIGPYPVIFFTRLFYDRSAPLRREAARALGGMGYQDGASILLSATRFDPDPQVRAEAARALAQIGAPMVIQRFAQPDFFGQVNRAMAGLMAVALAGFLSAGANLLFGSPDLAALIGLGTGAVLGAADGLNGERRPVRNALIGCAGAWLSAWGAGGWIVPLLAFGLPAAGAASGSVRTSLVQRLAGLFVGAIIGFAAALIAAVIFTPAG